MCDEDNMWALLEDAQDSVSAQKEALCDRKRSRSPLSLSPSKRARGGHSGFANTSLPHTATAKPTGKSVPQSKCTHTETKDHNRQDPNDTSLSAFDVLPFFVFENNDAVSFKFSDDDDSYDLPYVFAS